MVLVPSIRRGSDAKVFMPKAKIHHIKMVNTTPRPTKVKADS
jgi:hypothetical protein